MGAPGTPGGLASTPTLVTVHPPAHEPLPCGHPGGGRAGPLATSTAPNSRQLVQPWLPSFAQFLHLGAANQALGLPL